MDVSFEQWALFLATSFRARYLAVARRLFPELEPDLPLVRGSRLTVLQVNGGEAVHFLYTTAPAPQSTACRAVALETPGGIPLRDWALLDEEGYLRFVERLVGGERLCHFVVFPQDDDGHAEASLAADRAVQEHAAALGRLS